MTIDVNDVIDYVIRIKVKNAYIYNKIMFGEMGFCHNRVTNGDVEYRYLLGETEKAVKVSTANMNTSPYGVQLLYKKGYYFVWVPKSIVEYKTYRLKILIWEEWGSGIGLNDELFKELGITPEPYKC